MGPFEQQPILVEEIVSSLESSPTKDTGSTPTEQGSTRSLLPRHLPRGKAQLLPNPTLNRPYQPRKHIPKRLFLREGFS